MLDTLEKPSKVDRSFLVLVLGSIILALIYGYRYNRISQTLPKGYSEDLKSISMIIGIMCVWNLFITIFASSFFNNIHIFRQLSPDTSIREFSLYDTEVFSQKNGALFTKDCKFFAFFVISMILFNGFSNSILKTIEYISFYKNSMFENIFNDEDMEKLIAETKPRKSVSFDSTLTTFNYLSSDLYVTTECCVMPISNIKRTVTKYITAFACALTVYVIVLPDELMMNSTSCLFSTLTGFIIRFDHIYFSLATLFILDVIIKFSSVANHPNIANFPRLTSVLCHFSWAYCCITLVVSFCLSVILNDVFMNIVLITLQSMMGKTNTFQDVPRQLFTLIIINYVQHCLTPSSCKDSCSSVEYYDSVNESLFWLKSTFTSSWIITNFICFVAIPMFTWILLVELKFRKL